MRLAEGARKQAEDVTTPIGDCIACPHRDTLLAAGSEAVARSQGTLRLEGKDYLVQDGDVLHIRHSG